MELSVDSPPPFSSYFIKKLQQLPEKLIGEESEKAYFTFFEYFGTHFIHRAKMGAYYGQLSVMTEEAVRELEDEYTTLNMDADNSCNQSRFIRR